MRVLVTGGAGYLGAEVVAQASAAGHEVIAASRRLSGSSSGEGRAAYRDPGSSTIHLDVTDADVCRAVVADVAPDVVIHTAFVQTDWATTADGAVHVALAARELGAHLVFVSSDAIFSGADSPYDEQAHPDPVTRYGAAKAAAETAIRAVLPTATIARSSLILGPDSSMERLVHALAGGDDGILFTDQIRCPVHRDDLAAGLLELAGSGEQAPSTAAAPTPSVAPTWAG
ncbi:sugar nucleotide-binding protein [Flexivirga alba]|uniref:Sugar nucleotide-binding protein n=1 Tax=Flexivirga alba TaxID=702742 RepID=A0ABW2AL60_9MICO